MNMNIDFGMNVYIRNGDVGCLNTSEMSIPACIYISETQIRAYRHIINIRNVQLSQVPITCIKQHEMHGHEKIGFNIVVFQNVETEMVKRNGEMVERYGERE